MLEKQEEKERTNVEVKTAHDHRILQPAIIMRGCCEVAADQDVCFRELGKVGQRVAQPNCKVCSLYFKLQLLGMVSSLKGSIGVSLRGFQRNRIKD